MAKITRLSNRSDWIELDFVERERIPSELMQLGIRLRLSGISLSNTIRKLNKLGVERSRKAVYDWMQKADLQLADSASPDHIVLDETVIRINGQQFWLYAALDLEINKYLHICLFTTTTAALIQMFLREFQQKRDVEDAVFLVDYASILRQHFAEQAPDFRRLAMKTGMLSNVSLES